MTEPLLTPAQVAEELHVTVGTVRRWITTGELRAAKAGPRRWTVRRSDLDRFLAALSKTAAFSELRARLYARTLELDPHPDLLGELRRLRARYTAGSASVVTPRVGGSHCDMAQALALAVYGRGETYAAPVAVATIVPLYGGVGSGYGEGHPVTGSEFG